MCTVFLPPGDNPIAVNKYIVCIYVCIYIYIYIYIYIDTQNDGIKEELNGGVPSTDGNNRIAFIVCGWKKPNEN